MLSLRATTCPTCQGTRRQTIDTPRRTIEIECWRCFGAGEISRRIDPPPEAATTACPWCRGSGRYRRRGSFVEDRHGRRWVPNAGYLAPCQGWFRTVAGRREWQPNPSYEPQHELAWCVRCRGAGWLPCGVLPASGSHERAGYSPREEDTSSAVGAGLALMRRAGQQTSVLVLEVAYGEVGTYVRRRLGEPVELAIWPFTRPGRLLLERLQLARGTRPHRALARARASTEPVVASMAAVAQTAAVAALELALARHYEADAEGGGQTLRLARRLQEARNPE